MPYGACDVVVQDKEDGQDFCTGRKVVCSFRGNLLKVELLLATTAFMKELRPVTSQGLWTIILQSSVNILATRMYRLV